MNVDTGAHEALGTRQPSPSFLKRRHERMRNRLNNNNSPSSTEEEEGSNTSLPVAEETMPAIEVSLDDEANTTTTIVKKANDASTASSTAVRSFRQLRAKRKNRVPGGAAAKLIGKAYTEDGDEEQQYEGGDTRPVEDEEDGSDMVPTDEFIKIRDEARSAFEKGTKDNRRYHSYEPTTSTSPQQTPGVRPAPSRGQAVHETPTAAVLDLIGGRETPKSSHTTKSKRFPDGIPTILSSKSREQLPPPPKDYTQTPSVEVSPRNAFQAPPRKEEHLNADDTESKPQTTTAASEEMEPTTKGKSPLEQPLLSKKAEQRVAQMKEHMQDPSSTLADLIATIATPEDKTFSRGYMVHRKNACGALQVLTSKKNKRIQICWTLGVLPALASVLEDSGTRDLAVEFPDIPTRKEFLEARKRAVGSLLNLSMAQENRLAVFHTPRLVANLVRVIELDQYDARKGCCAVLAHLAKTKENRLLMAQVPGLIDAMTSIIEPNVIIVPPKAISEEEEDDDSSRTPDHDFPLRNSSSEDASSREPFSSGSFSSSDGESQKKEKQEDGRYQVDVSSVPTYDPAKAAKRYDEDRNEYLHGTRLNVFAILSHLVKEKDNAVSGLRRYAFFRAICVIPLTTIPRSLKSTFLSGTSSWSTLWSKSPNFMIVQPMSTR